MEHNNGTYNDEARAWYQTFDYDRYGNRGINIANTSDNADAANSALQLADFSEANNRITRAGFAYDAAGNLIAEPGKSYTYDAENKIVTATVVGGGTSQYFYDGNGSRVRKVVGGVATRYEYGAGGGLLAERDEATKAVTKEYFYKGGELLATTKNGGDYEYATADHLGSPRVWTDGSGNVVVGGRHDYLPFGEELFAGYGVRTTDQGYAANTQADGQRNQFDGYERDDETGLDFAQARYYASAQGRFTSVDPIFITTNRVVDPQQINLYHFARNNPLRWTDPTGEDIVETVDDKYKERYEAWKKALLATESGRAMWNKYANDKNFTLNITVSAERGNGARTDNYVFNDGKLTGATIILGDKLGQEAPSKNLGYEVISSLRNEPYGDHINDISRAVGKFAHEFGHVEDFVARPAFAKSLMEYNQRIKGMGAKDAKEIERIHLQMFGANIDTISYDKEMRAERTTIPVLQEHFGKNMPKRVRKAIEDYKKAHP